MGKGQSPIRPAAAFAVIAAALLLAAPAAGAAKKPASGKVKTRSAQASATGNQAIATAMATCPKNTRAVGGGFGQQPIGAISAIGAVGVIFESRKVGQRSWRASMQLADEPPTSTAVLTTFVYCRKGAPKTVTSAETVPIPALDGHNTTAAPPCPGKRTPAAGGFVAGPPVITGPAVVNFVYDSARSGRSWLLRAISSTNGPGSLTGEVYCRRGKRLPLRSATSPPNASNATVSSVRAACPKGKKGKKGKGGKRRKLNALSGGIFQPATVFDDTNLAYFIPAASHRSGRGWSNTAFVGTDGRAHTFDTQVLCG